MAIAELQNIW